MHFSLLLLFLILSGIAILTFIIVFLSSKHADQKSIGMANALQKRMWFILILFVILVMFASVTIPKSPYYLFADEQPSKVVHVATAQFLYIMSYDAIDPKRPTGEPSIEIAVDELVEFRVTSLDVNHAFAIYDADAELIAQTQAMPGYVNNLRWKFDAPGVYNILCLEFCGAGHQVMRTKITVK